VAFVIVLIANEDADLRLVIVRFVDLAEFDGVRLAALAIGRAEARHAGAVPVNPEEH
jgi:hypothetical protein